MEGFVLGFRMISIQLQSVSRLDGMFNAVSGAGVKLFQLEMCLMWNIVSEYGDRSFSVRCNTGRWY